MTGRDVTGSEAVVCCSASSRPREQAVLKLPHSAPQCCSHCPRSRRPTHNLTSSPQPSRKFISSTYGLWGQEESTTRITSNFQGLDLLPKGLRFEPPQMAELPQSKAPYHNCTPAAEAPYCPHCAMNTGLSYLFVKHLKTRRCLCLNVLETREN